MPDGPVTEAGAAFEVDQLEMTGDRLELTGRWYGVRGRRFMRPTLTLIGAAGRTRALAELDDKPWAAEDGESWRATFTLDPPEEHVTEIEVAVAPDIAVVLELPSDLPRSARAPSGRPAGAAPAIPPPERRDSAAAETARRRLEAVAAERDALDAALAQAREEAEVARSDAAAAHAATAAARAETAAAQAEAAALQDELTAAQAAAVAHDVLQEALERAEREVAAAERERERADDERARADEERARAVSERDRAVIERDRAVELGERLRAEGERLRAEREQAPQTQTRVVSIPVRERPGARAFRRPAAYGWPQRVAVLAVLLIAVVALLIILQSA
jgi:hypothetical protein